MASAPLRDVERQVRLVISDVDGTLVTPDKVLTRQAREAVQRVIDAGIHFTIMSSRPARGLTTLIDALHLRDPIASLNGGLIVRPDLSVIDELLVPRDVAEIIINVLTDAQLDVWIYTGEDWRVRSRHAPHVEREERTVGFPPTVVTSLDAVLDRAIKIVGVSDDDDAMARCVAEVRRAAGERVSAVLSQPYYLDVTHPRANKGDATGFLSDLLGIPAEQIATIGDMPSDVLMFARSSISIAMGNASPEVRGGARFVTRSNAEEGFALAMHRFVLGGASVAI